MRAVSSSSNPSRAGDTSVGVFFPRRTSDRASDTPVAIYVHPQRFTELPRRCLFLFLSHTSAFLRVGVDREMRKPPRPSPSPARESLRRVMARDAFHHWGPFLGSGGRYSPGPTTDTPLLAMGRPLDDTLAPPWVFVRTSPISHSGAAGSPTYLSPAVPDDGFTHRRSLRARPPFTRPCRPFWSAFAELIRGQTPPNDFCNCTTDVRATKPGPSFPRRDDGLDHLPFRTHHAALSSSDARRAALRPPR